MQRHAPSQWLAVENEGFRNMVHSTEPCYIIPFKQHITDSAVPKLYEEVKTRVLHFDMQCLATRSKESYVTITAVIPVLTGLYFGSLLQITE